MRQQAAAVLGPALDIEFGSEGYIVRRQAVPVTLGCARNSLGWQYRLPTEAGFGYQAQIATWKGLKAGAASLVFDDCGTASLQDRDALDAAGILVTWPVIANWSFGENPPVGYMDIDDIKSLFDDGHELANHSMAHSMPWYQPGVDDPEDFAAAHYEEWDAACLAAVAGSAAKDIGWTLAYVYGRRDNGLDAAVAGYAEAVRGYSLLGESCRLVGLNDPTPESPDGPMLLRVYSIHSEDAHGTPTQFAQQAVAQGKWAIFPQHDHWGAGQIGEWAALAAADPGVWIAPIGHVVEYIKLRDEALISSFAAVIDGAVRTITFDVTSNLNPARYDGEVTVALKIGANDAVLSAEADGVPVSTSYKTVGADRYLLFDVAPTAGPSMEIVLASSLVVEVPINTACYEISGGIWSRRARANLVGYNIGDNAADAAYWTTTGSPVSVGWVDGGLYAGGVLEIVGHAVNSVYHLRTAGALLAAVYYQMAAVMEIPNGDENTDPTTYGVLSCNAAVDGTGTELCGSGNRRYRYLGNCGTTAYFEMWQKILGTAATYYPGYTVLPGQTARVVAVTLTLDSDAATYASGLGECVGVIANTAAGYTTVHDSLTLTWASGNAPKLLPIGNDGSWTVVVEVAWGLHGSDYNAAHYPATWERILEHAKLGRDGFRYATSAGVAFAVNSGAGDRRVTVAEDRPATPWQSRWIGVCGQAGRKARMWTAAAENLLFLGPGTEANGAQDSASEQYADGVLIGAMNSSSAATIAGGGGVSSGGNLGGVIRRLKFYTRRRA